MRLIDADKLKEELKVNGLGYQYYMLDNAPTVEAILVEWLLERAKLCTADYADCLHYAVEAWHNEQKYMVNGQWKFPKAREKENDS